MERPGHIETMMGYWLDVGYNDAEVNFSDQIDTIYINIADIDDIVTYLMYFKKWWEEKNGTPDA